MNIHRKNTVLMVLSVIAHYSLLVASFWFFLDNCFYYTHFEEGLICFLLYIITFPIVLAYGEMYEAGKRLRKDLEEMREERRKRK